MKVLLILTTIILLSFLNLFAQAPDTLWTRTYGGSSDDWGYSVQQITDGNYIVAGFTMSFGAGGRDVWLLKIDSVGDTIWTKTYGGSGWDEGKDVQQTNDGGYIITGYTDSFSGGLPDVFIIKTDENGDTLWTKSYGSTEADHGYSVQQTYDNGYIIVGYKGNQGLWLIKTDLSGDTVWAKTYGKNLGYSVIQTPDSGYIITGSKFVSGYNTSDYWLLKTDSAGDTMWTKTMGGSYIEAGYSLQQTLEAGYIITGIIVSPAWYADIWLINSNSNGDTLWTKHYGGSNDEAGNCVEQTSDSGYIIAGYTMSYGSGYKDLYLIKTNNNGDMLWTKTYGGSNLDEGLSVQQTDDGGYIITGYTMSFGSGYKDLWLIKTASDPSNLGEDTQIKLPIEYSINQNYPNPFNPSTKIKYELPKPGKVKIEVFNLLGQKINTLLNKQMPAGSHEIEFNSKDLPSGVYLYKIEVDGYQQVKKMILMK